MNSSPPINHSLLEASLKSAQGGGSDSAGGSSAGGSGPSDLGAGISGGLTSGGTVEAMGGRALASMSQGLGGITTTNIPSAVPMMEVSKIMDMGSFKGMGPNILPIGDKGKGGAAQGG